MKLIDLLVRELPKHGGWPDGAEAVVQDADDMEFYFYTGGPVVNTGKSWWFKDGVDGSTWIFYEGKFEVADDHDTTTITRDQYQSALAASQKVEWSGDGLPPVGCECEYHDSNGEWYPVTIKYESDQLVVISGMTKFLGVEQGTEIARDIIIDKPKFRPLRSEEDKKRDAMVNDMVETIFYYYGNPKGAEGYIGLAERIIEAIEIGKIPGVKLDD